MKLWGWSMKNQKKEIKPRDARARTHMNRRHPGVDDVHYPELRFGALVSLEVVKLIKRGDVDE